MNRDNLIAVQKSYLDKRSFSIKMSANFGFCLKSRRDFFNAGVLCLVIFLLSLISTTNAIKCYVCGVDSETPFYESDFNETFIKQRVQASCDEFDRIPLEEKHKYEMECPDNFVGCMLNVGATVSRTCSQYRVDDCKTVNKVHYCYCHRPLCNGENAESILEKLGDVGDDEEEAERENIDSEEASGADDDEDFITSTSRKVESTEKSAHDSATTSGNNFSVLSATTSRSTINGAVTSNLSKKLPFIMSFVILSHRNNCS